MTNTQKPSSTGGTIVYTDTGLVHMAGKMYSGSAAQKDLDATVSTVAKASKKSKTTRKQG